ncbi:MAG TPA: hypothetical protein VFX92_10780 [Candidatus Krumholzibacteria bacterium]|nr:hypothetical protein [Candidatus Krumholzibacteria bacterium]
MRVSNRVFRTLALLAGILITVLAVSGCPKQEDFPTALDLPAPPTPANFVITQPSPDAFDYDFAWDISDPGSVDRYRIYLLGSGFTGDELVVETEQTSFQATFPFSVSGARFAVSAVSTESVEGARAVADAP